MAGTVLVNGIGNVIDMANNDPVIPIRSENIPRVRKASLGRLINSVKRTIDILLLIKDKRCVVLKLRFLTFCGNQIVWRPIACCSVRSNIGNAIITFMPRAGMGSAAGRAKKNKITPKPLSWNAFKMNESGTLSPQVLAPSDNS